MSRILNGLLGRGLTMARGFTTRPEVRQHPAFIHPEKRRTFPIVYFTRNKIPHTLEKTLEKKAGPKIEVKIEDNPYSQEGCLRHLFFNRGDCFLTDMHRWSEFRRKIIYGVY